MFVVGSSKDVAHTADLVTIDGLLPGAASRILATQWHDYSDEAIQSAISSISVSESPASVSGHPYHTALRVLSSAVHSLTKVRREMEENLRVLQEKEHARRQRALELMKELQGSERDIARRVVQSLFTDDDEGLHKVEQVSFDRMVDPNDDNRLHDSDWATGRLASAVKLAIVGGVDKARSSIAAKISQHVLPPR